MKILEFRFLSRDDIHDLESYKDGNAWSRIYEYKLAEEFLKKNMSNTSMVHNSKQPNSKYSNLNVVLLAIKRDDDV